MYNVPVIKCHVTVMKLLLKMTHLAALQGHVSPHQVYKCLIINIRTGRQLFLAKFRTSQGQILPWKKKDFFHHLKAQNVFRNFILYSNFTIFLLKNLTSYI